MLKLVQTKKFLSVFSIVFIILALLATPLVQFVQNKTHAAGEDATIYFGNAGNTAPVTNIFIPLNTTTKTVNLYMDVGSINVNGFDLKITTTGNLIFSKVDDAEDGNKFTTKVFADITNGGHTLRYTKVSTNTTGVIKGTLNLAVITFITPQQAGTGTVSFEAVTVTSPAFNNGLTVAKTPLTYTVDLPDKVTPTLPPGTIPTNTPIPTPTVNPNSTQFVFTIILPGIGGDKGNQLPIHIQRQLTVEVFDRTNKKLITKTGIVTFDPTSGQFTGSIDMGNSLNNGPYTVKVTTMSFLRKLIAGIQDVTPGSSYKMPETTLVPGDINGDNILDMKDYNIYVSCFNTKQDNKTCGQNRVPADLNDDGRNDTPNDLTDYKLLFASFANREGD